MAEASEQTSGVSPGLVIADTYELTRMIGQGGMGAVWEAKHLRLPGKKVAVKVLLASAEPGSELASRFRREAEIAAKLAHPSIVQVLDFNVLPSGQPYLVMELLQGESLARRLNRGPIPLPEVLAMVRQIGSALQAAHRAGVVHRDLKPDNVFLVPPEDEGPPRVKVLDFGISKMLGSTSMHTQEQRVMGTPQYMAPEQAKGQNSAIDGRTDLFSLGCIVYEMLGGRPPFSGDTLAELVFKVVYEPHEPLAKRVGNLPPNVTEAVDRALAKEPANRFSDSSAFITALTGRPLPQGDAGDPRKSGEATAATISSQDGVTPPVPPRSMGPAAMAATLASQDRPAPAFALTAPLAPTGPQAEISAQIPRQAPDKLPERAPEPDSSVRFAADAVAPRSKAPMIIVGVLVLGAAIGVVVWQMNKKPGKDHDEARADKQPAALVHQGAADAAPPPVVIDAGPVASDAAVAAAPDAGAIAQVDPHGGKKPIKPVTPPTPPPGEDDGHGADDSAAAAGLLDQAQAASSNDEAVRLAQRALAETGISPRQVTKARFVMAKAYCAKGDLSQAKPAFNKLPAGPRKKALKAFCANHEVPLP